MTRDTSKPKGKSSTPSKSRPPKQTVLLATILRSITGLETRMAAVESTQQNHHQDIDLLSSKLATPDHSKPKDYVLTDADWGRVIEEGWLCEFWSDGKRGCGVLLEMSPHEECRYGGISPRERNRDYMFWHSHCRPLNKPGVMQPHFGQSMPVDGEAKVLIQIRSGGVDMLRAIKLRWAHTGGLGDIMAYMVVPTIKKN